MKIITTGSELPSATLISNQFIDEYMARANGEYVKVYLYCLRHQNEDITDERIADALELTTGDVMRAISYWSRNGLMDMHEEKELAEEKEEEKTAARSMRDLSDDEDFAELLYCLQKYLSKIFSHQEVESVAYMYDVMKMPKDLIEYLTEICVQKGKNSLRYIEAVARDWHKKGIMTVEQAKEEGSIYDTEVWGVMKAFGITNRAPGSEEQKYIRKWFKDFGFSKEIVYEACDRTLAATGKPGFKYADSILTKWHECNVKTPEDIAALEPARKKNQPAAKSGKNKFANFDQRDNDLDSEVFDNLLKKIN